MAETRVPDPAHYPLPPPNQIPKGIGACNPCFVSQDSCLWPFPSHLAESSPVAPLGPTLWGFSYACICWPPPGPTSPCPLQRGLWLLSSTQCAFCQAQGQAGLPPHRLQWQRKQPFVVQGHPSAFFSEPISVPGITFPKGPLCFLWLSTCQAPKRGCEYDRKHTMCWNSLWWGEFLYCCGPETIHP